MEHATKSTSDQQGRGAAAPRGAAPSAAARIVDGRPAAIAQRELADAVGNSPRVLAQQASLRAVLGPRLIAQAKRLYGVFGNAFAQRRPSGPIVQRWPTTLPSDVNATAQFASLAAYFRHLAGLPRDTAKTVAEALLKDLFSWRQPNFTKPWEIESSEIQDATGVQTRLGISKGDWSGLVFEARTRKEGSPRDQPLVNPPQATNLDANQIIPAVQGRITNSSDDFALIYDNLQLNGLVTYAATLGLDAKECEEVILIGCRKAKPRSAEQLKDQMYNLKGVVARRGYPFKFAGLLEFQNFSIRLKGLVGNLTVFRTPIPNDDVRIQGSSLRTSLAEDVDIAVMVSQDNFVSMCRNRYQGRVKTKGQGGTVIDLGAKSYGELVTFAGDAQRGVYNAEAKQFAAMFLGGKFDAKTRSSGDTALADLTSTIAGEYTSLNIESVTILVIGGPFDLKPYIRL